MEHTITTHTFHVRGMHCNACILMTESTLMEHPSVKLARSSLSTHTVEITGDFGAQTPEEIARELSQPLLPHGYSLSVEKQAHESNSRNLLIAAPIALAFMLAFVLLQKSRIIDLVDVGTMSYGAIMLIGVVASLSSCMAVVGGLLLSMSATFAKKGDTLKPQVLFHAGRLVSFFVFGGVIGMLGSFMTLSITATFALNMVIVIVMLMLGINLLDIFHGTKRFQIGVPKFISRHALRTTQLNHSLTPLVVGIATFFLPCGFTQSMQVYTLTTGSFTEGALTMSAFALGTLPVLLLISMSSFTVRKGRYSAVFFKTAGLLVIMFAIFNLLNSLSALGIIPSLFNY